MIGFAEAWESVNIWPIRSRRSRAERPARFPARSRRSAHAFVAPASIVATFDVAEFTEQAAVPITTARASASASRFILEVLTEARCRLSPEVAGHQRVELRIGRLGLFPDQLPLGGVERRCSFHHLGIELGVRAPQHLLGGRLERDRV